MYDIFLSAAIFSSSMGAFKFFLWLLLSSLDKAFASPKKKAKICLAEAVWASPSAEDQLKNQEELVEEIESLHRRNQLPATKVVKMLTKAKAGGLRVKAPTSQSLNKANEDAALRWQCQEELAEENGCGPSRFPAGPTEGSTVLA